MYRRVDIIIVLYVIQIPSLIQLFHTFTKVCFVSVQPILIIIILLFLFQVLTDCSALQKIVVDQ